MSTEVKLFSSGAAAAWTGTSLALGEYLVALILVCLSLVLWVKGTVDA